MFGLLVFEYCVTFFILTIEGNAAVNTSLQVSIDVPVFNAFKCMNRSQLWNSEF